MAEAQSDAENLSIRCPGCGQRFKVGIELRDRMVECGTCENRFRVNDEVILRTKKFYPGEHRNRSLDGFSRVPKTVQSMPSDFKTVEYAEEPAKLAMIQPASPLRLVLGSSAVAAIFIVALMLIFGGGAGGVLYGTVVSKRLMLAGFTALLSGILLVAANPGARHKAVVGALAAAACLLSLPFVFTQGNRPVASVTDGELFARPGLAGEAKETESEEILALKEEIGFAPLAREIERFQSLPGNAGRGAAGIWLRGLQEFHRLQIKDYIIRNTGADPSSHMYPRPPDYLMVVSSVTDDLAELARLCERFGEVRRVIEPLRVVEVVVDNSCFVEGPQDKLSDPADPAFYQLNRRELESIDLERARRTVVRLASVEPKLYRKDIARRMQQLMREGDRELREETAKALLVWGEPGDGAEEVVREAVTEIDEGGHDVPESLVKFLVVRGDLAVIPVIDGLWSRDFTRWEESYGALGPAIEDSVLARYPKASVTLRMSAVRLMGRVGTAKSIPVLEQSREGATPEVQLLIDRAIIAIQARS